MTQHGHFLLFTTQNVAVNVDVFFRGKTAWLTQQALLELVAVQVHATAKHLKNIWVSGDQSRGSVISKIELTEPDQATLTMLEAA